MTNWNDNVCSKCNKTPREYGYIDAEPWTQWDCPECGGALGNKKIYKGWEIVFNPKPIGTNGHDYDATHGDYDGGNGMYITAESVEGCMKAIDCFIAEA